MPMLLAQPMKSSLCTDGGFRWSSGACVSSSGEMVQVHDPGSREAETGGLLEFDLLGRLQARKRVSF